MPHNVALIATIAADLGLALVVGLLADAWDCRRWWDTSSPAF